MMLASRGFAYHSKETASHAHAHCDCRVVAGMRGLEVDGYDWHGMRQRWAALMDECGVDGTNENASFDRRVALNRAA